MVSIVFLSLLVIGLFLGNLRAKIGLISKELAVLRAELASLKGTSSSQSAPQQSVDALIHRSPEITEHRLDQQPSSIIKHAIKSARPVTMPTDSGAIRPAQPRKSFKNTEFWKNLEAQFAGNVTGIVGTLAVVLGVIFLGIYAALQLGPLGRFGVVCGFSLALYAVYFLLHKKSYWRNLSLWIRSASGLTFLMACLGSVAGGVMQWVTDPWMGLGLLCLGIAANLALGFLNGGQLFASLHVIFNLLALSVVPMTETTFSIAALVAFVGVVMSVKDRHWDKHILVTTLGFFLLHFYWLDKFKSSDQEFPVQPILAILLCLVVGVAGILSHYRKTYQAPGIQKTPLLAHLVAWATLGLNLFAHARGSVWSTVFLGLAVVLAFGMSMKAHSLSIPWLYVCDRLVSLLLALLTVISLRKFGYSGYELAIISAIVTTIFLRVVSENFEKIVFKFSNVILLLVYGVVAGQVFILMGLSAPVAISSLYLLCSSFLILAVVFPFIQKKVEENRFDTFIEIPLALHGFFTLLLAIKNPECEWFLLIPLGISLFAVVLRDKLKNVLLDASVLIGTAMSVVLGTWFIIGEHNSIQSDAILCIGLFVIGGLSFKLSRSEYFQQKVTWPGVGIVWLTAMAASYSFTVGVSPLLPGLAWLSLSLFAGALQESKTFQSDEALIHARTDVFIAGLGLASLALFFCRFFLVDISNEALAFGFVRVRFFAEFLSLGTLFYWLSATNSRNRSVSIMIDFLLEVFLAVSVVYILYELDSLYHPLVWALASFVGYFIGKKFKGVARLLLYSYWFYFGSLFHVAFLSTTIATPSVLFLDQAWVIGLISAGISTAFMVFAHKDKQTLLASPLTLPPALKGLARFKSLVERLGLKILLYPLFASIGCFLFWSFDKSVLSLLWVVECFVLFLISMFLREPQFRTVSMLGIGLIFFRIVFHDLTGSDFFIKALVFISVGIILIVMNTIYNKYKHRYEQAG